MIARKATLEDADALAVKMPADWLLTAKRLSGLAAADAFRLDILGASDAWAIEQDGEVIGLFGVTRLPTGLPLRVGSLWGTLAPLTDAQARALALRSRTWLKLLTPNYDVLAGWVRECDAKAQGVVAMLRFKFTGKALLGSKAEPMLEFARLFKKQ